MSVIITVLTVFLVLCGLLVILLVMVQDDQGEGFALFGSSGQNPFNTGKNPLARMTGYLGIAFAVLALLTAVTVSWSSNQRSRLEQLSQQGNLQDKEWFLQDPKGEQASVPAEPSAEATTAQPAEDALPPAATTSTEVAPGSEVPLQAGEQAVEQPPAQP